MYALQDYIGEERVSQALAAFVKDYAFKGPPYPTSVDLVNYLRKVTPPEFQYLYEDSFENITIFDNRAVSAQLQPASGRKVPGTNRSGGQEVPRRWQGAGTSGPAA